MMITLLTEIIFYQLLAWLRMVSYYMHNEIHFSLQKSSLMGLAYVLTNSK